MARRTQTQAGPHHDPGSRESANPRAKDLVNRHFAAVAPNRRWVADFTYCRTMSGWAFTAFVIDVFARKIVGWKVASEMTTHLVDAAITNAIDCRKRSGVVDLSALVHHSDYAEVFVKSRNQHRVWSAA